MDMMIVLRFLHVVLGVYWAGALIFTALYLEPSVRAVGPAGGQVMAQLVRRGHLTVMPVVAFVTILTGIEMYRRVTGNFDPALMAAGPGLALGIGGVSAIIAFVIGVFVLRPTVLRVMATTQAAMQLPEGAERERGLAAVQPLRARITATGRLVATLLFVTVTTMAVARYL